jgi:hypothetical protein
MEPNLYRKYREEVERLDGEIAHYDRQWDTVPHFAWVLLLAPFVGYAYGWAAAVVEVFVAFALVGVRAYLIAMRKSEVVWTRDRLLAELGEAEKVPPTEARVQSQAA